MSITEQRESDLDKLKEEFCTVFADDPTVSAVAFQGYNHKREEYIEPEMEASVTDKDKLKVVPSKIASFEDPSSVKVTVSPAALIVQQNPVYSATIAAHQQQAKQEFRLQLSRQNTSASDQLKQELPRHLKRAMELGSEKVLLCGCSSS